MEVRLAVTHQMRTVSTGLYIPVLPYCLRIGPSWNVNMCSGVATEPPITSNEDGVPACSRGILCGVGENNVLSMEQSALP